MRYLDDGSLGNTFSHQDELWRWQQTAKAGESLFLMTEGFQGPVSANLRLSALQSDPFRRRFYWECLNVTQHYYIFVILLLPRWHIMAGYSICAQNEILQNVVNPSCTFDCMWRVRV
jgi:hypothetical protein